MTLREKVADWISGGALSAMYSEMKAAMQRSVDAEKARDAAYAERSEIQWRLQWRLRAIIERGDTAKPNGTVKAMVRIAREGLGK